MNKFIYVIFLSISFCLIANADNVYDTRQIIEDEIKATQDFISYANQKISNIDALDAKALYGNEELVRLNKKIASYSPESLNPQVNKIEYITEQEKAPLIFIDTRLEKSLKAKADIYREFFPLVSREFDGYSSKCILNRANLFSRKIPFSTYAQNDVVLFVTFKSNLINAFDMEEKRLQNRYSFALNLSAKLDQRNTQDRIDAFKALGAWAKTQQYQYSSTPNTYSLDQSIQPNKAQNIQLYDQQGNLLGHMDNGGGFNSQGSVYDSNGNSAGKINEKGQYFDGNGNYAGRIDSKGNFYDNKGNYGGRVGN
jgi:hypothetical protein